MQAICNSTWAVPIQPKGSFSGALVPVPTKTFGLRSARGIFNYLTGRSNNIQQGINPINGQVNGGALMDSRQSMFRAQFGIADGAKFGDIPTRIGGMRGNSFNGTPYLDLNSLANRAGPFMRPLGQTVDQRYKQGYGINRMGINNLNLNG